MVVVYDWRYVLLQIEDIQYGILERTNSYLELYLGEEELMERRQLNQRNHLVILS